MKEGIGWIKKVHVWLSSSFGKFLGAESGLTPLTIMGSLLMAQI
jgi:hypothetical protein